MSLSPEAEAIARRRAQEDRETLARLVREGRVRRDASLGANVPGAALFREEIEQAAARRPVNLAIRPRKRRR